LAQIRPQIGGGGHTQGAGFGVAESPVYGDQLRGADCAMHGRPGGAAPADQALQSLRLDPQGLEPGFGRRSVLVKAGEVIELAVTL